MSDVRFGSQEVTPPPGAALVRASWVGTAVLVAVTVPAVAWTDRLGMLSVAVSLPMFVGGTLAMLAAFARAVERSRTEAIGMGGLYLLADAAPRHVQRSMMTSLSVEVVVGLVGAGLRPYTPVAFGILASLWGLGLAGLWGARHGVFDARAPGSEAAAPRREPTGT